MPGARGETTIYLPDGSEVTVLYTNRALAEAEQHLGRSIIGVAEGFANGTSGITEIAQTLRVGMEAARRDARSGGRTVTLQDAFDVLDQVGFPQVAAAVMTAVAEVLGYDGETEPEPDPNL